MRTLLIILGGAAVAYGSYLLLQKKMSATGTTTGGTTNFSGDNKTVIGADGQAVRTGPTMQSCPGGVDNGISQVQRYSTDYTNWFPPITYIELPGPASLDDLDSQNMHQKVHF